MNIWGDKLKMNIKFTYILALFFIVTILISTVSALEFVEDYNLTPLSFSRNDNPSGHGFKMAVPSESDFKYVADYSGEIKNDDGEGLLATYSNFGEFNFDVSLICYIEDNTDEGSLISEFIDNIEQKYELTEEDNGTFILKLKNESSVISDSNSGSNSSSNTSSNTSSINGSVDASNGSVKDASDSLSKNLSQGSDSIKELSDNLSSGEISAAVNLDDSDDSNISSPSDNSSEMADVQTEAQEPEYALVIFGDEKTIILFGNNLDLMEDMINQTDFEMGIK